MALKDYNFAPLVEQHEKYKLKFQDLTIEDCFNWISLKEQISIMAINMDSEIKETKIDLNNEKWKRMIELKAELWPDWKKKHTESTAQWIINQEFLEQDKLLEKLWEKMRELSEIAKNVVEYTNWVKRYMDISNDYQNNMKPLD